MFDKGFSRAMTMFRQKVFYTAKTSVAVLFFITLTGECFSQVRAGLGQLKIAPGTRQQHLGSSMTAGLDEPFALFANPANAGFLRNFQFGVNQNNWLSGINQYSLLFGKQIRIKSRFTDRVNLAFSMVALNLDSFDATQGQAPAEKANDFLSAISIGMPLGHWRRHNFALGGSFKFFRSTLGGYSGNALIGDLGLLFKSRRYRLSNTPRSWHGIYSFGFAVNNFGGSLKHFNTKTPLPTTLRAGVGMNIGRHNGMHIQVLADYQKPRDEDWNWRFGLELQNVLGFLPFSKSFNRLISLRGGYNFIDKQNERLVNKLTMGLSIRLDDYDVLSLTPKNYAIRADYGLIRSGLLSDNYQGGATQFNLNPEAFSFVSDPYHTAKIDSRPEKSYWQDEPVRFSWTPAHDGDLFDQVNYILLLSNDQEQINQKLKAILNIGRRELKTLAPQPDKWLANIDDSHLTFLTLTKPQQATGSAPLAMLDTYSIKPKRSTTYWMAELPAQTDSGAVLLAAGSYYWTIVAYDQNMHIKPIARQRNRLQHFQIRQRPDFIPLFTNLVCKGDSLLADLIIYDKNKTTIDEEPVVRIEATANVAGAIRSDLLGEFQGNLMSGKPDTIYNVAMHRNFTEMIATVNPTSGDRMKETSYDNNVVANRAQCADVEVSMSAASAPFIPGVHFKLGQFGLTCADSLELNRLSGAVNSLIQGEYPNLFMQINGHTDRVGWRGVSSDSLNALKNCSLSFDRVKNVGDFLALSSKNIGLNGFGQTRPILADAWASRINRRVEISLYENSCPPITEPTNCSQIDSLQSQCAVPRINMVDSGSPLRFTIKLKELNNLPSGQFTFIQKIETTPNTDFVTYNYEPAPTDSALLSNGKTFIWKGLNLQGADSLTIRYTAQASYKKLGSVKVSASSYLEFDYDMEIDQSNNNASTTVFVVGKPEKIQKLTRYRVRAGDTLGGIASFFYGNSKHYTAIYEENKELIRSPNLINPGWELRIPCLP